MENPTASAQVADRTEQLPLASQWEKGRLIGRGTFGSVYIASNQETRALCALKEFELLPNDPNSAECMMQLKQEIEVLSQLRHPNILQYYASEILTRQAAYRSLKGSLDWMAPESTDHDHTVDMWSLGCSIIEMLWGYLLRVSMSSFCLRFNHSMWAAAMFKVMRSAPSVAETVIRRRKGFPAVLLWKTAAC
ncbi:mitogen-activated protein kinase kinase kinase 5-like isoform X2 [Rhodamnia argentea]|uniref:mitogen-activated protein kinase kinase kinase n=1 Tax=Rhodamnia argentea TaxID=178133 RepID=A0ABM3H163_9MYRT|nr:mitogen-activated protein kinase kinase kinase 5-like isoform X2 [Rhodamnia argentea]